MIISISGIIKEEGASLNFQGDQKLDNLEFQGEPVEFYLPMNVRGSITNTGQVLLAKISLDGSIRLQCGACTGMYDQEIELSFEAMYKRFPDPEDPDIFTYQNDRIDLKVAALEHILLSLPTRKRCMQDCRGLCSKCGVDLNVNQCSC